MTELLSAAQMRAVERAAIDAGRVTGAELMERAGHGVIEAMFEHWPARAAAPHHAVVLCGPGNNGGDGFVVARLLAERGWRVELFLYGDPDKLPPDAKAQHDRWRELGDVAPCNDGAFDVDPSRLGPDSVIVDALFGTGLTRPLEGLDAVARMIAQVRGLADDAGAAFADHAPRIVSIDIPSGLCADSGRVLRAAPDAPAPVRADLTVTFHAEKLGHRLAEGPGVCGELAVKPIGLHRAAPSAAGRGGGVDGGGTEGGGADGGPADTGRVRLTGAPRNIGKSTGDHKYAHGHALILSGPPGTGGAARLAARGALRIGAGLVSVCCEDAAVPEHAARLDAVMIKRANGARDLAALLGDARLNALCLGPGLGVDRARALVPVALVARRAAVLDADALTAFADDPDTLFGLLHDKVVLTPHAGEFARLFPDLADRLAETPARGPAWSRVDAARAAASRAGCVVLLKGPDTVIAAPDGRCVVNSAHYDRAAPWLATAGTGDVLAGLVTGLLARGLEPVRAAESAAWCHVEAALRVGPGLISEDLPDALVRVLGDLGTA